MFLNFLRGEKMEENIEREEFIVSYIYNFIPYFLISLILIFFNEIFLGKLLLVFSIYNLCNGYCINKYSMNLEKKIVKFIRSSF